MRHDRAVRLEEMSPQLVRRLGAAELTYAEVGATRGAALPSGYHQLNRSRIIGSGPDACAVAASALLTWQVQLRGHLFQGYVTRRYLNALA